MTTNQFDKMTYTQKWKHLKGFSLDVCEIGEVLGSRDDTPVCVKDLPDELQTYFSDE